MFSSLFEKIFLKPMEIVQINDVQYIKNSKSQIPVELKNKLENKEHQHKRILYASLLGGLMVGLLSRKLGYLLYKKSIGWMIDPVVAIAAISYYEKFYGIQERHFTYLEEIQRRLKQGDEQMLQHILNNFLQHPAAFNHSENYLMRFYLTDYKFSKEIDQDISDPKFKEFLEDYIQKKDQLIIMKTQNTQDEQKGNFKNETLRKKFFLIMKTIQDKEFSYFNLVFALFFNLQMCFELFLPPFQFDWKYQTQFQNFAELITLKSFLNNLSYSQFIFAFYFAFSLQLLSLLLIVLNLFVKKFYIVLQVLKFFELVSTTLCFSLFQNIILMNFKCETNIENDIKYLKFFQDQEYIKKMLFIKLNVHKNFSCIYSYIQSLKKFSFYKIQFQSLDKKKKIRQQIWFKP